MCIRDREDIESVIKIYENIKKDASKIILNSQGCSNNNKFNSNNQFTPTLLYEKGDLIKRLLLVDIYMKYE